MLCGLWVSRLCTPAYRGLWVHDSRLRPNQTLVSYTLAGLAELSRLSSVSQFICSSLPRWFLVWILAIGGCFKEINLSWLEFWTPSKCTSYFSPPVSYFFVYFYFLSFEAFLTSVSLSSAFLSVNFFALPVVLSFFAWNRGRLPFAGTVCLPQRSTFPTGSKPI